MPCVSRSIGRFLDLHNRSEFHIPGPVRQTFDVAPKVQISRFSQGAVAIDLAETTLSLSRLQSLYVESFHCSLGAAHCPCYVTERAKSLCVGCVTVSKTVPSGFLGKFKIWVGWDSNPEPTPKSLKRAIVSIYK